MSHRTQQFGSYFEWIKQILACAIELMKKSINGGRKKEKKFNKISLKVNWVVQHNTQDKVDTKNICWMLQKDLNHLSYTGRLHCKISPV